jgi:two-component system, sensor histidine kinase PdtaS
MKQRVLLSANNEPPVIHADHPVALPGMAFAERASGPQKGAAMAPLAPPHPVVALNLGLALIATSSAPLLLLDSSLTIIAASPSFCRTFQIDPSKTDGCHLAELGAREWNIPQLTSLLNATASGFAEIEGYEIDLVREYQATRRLVLNARRLNYAGEDEVRLVLSITDITETRIAEKLKEDLLREKDVLLQELHHRVANSLQIIASVLLQNARKVQSDESRIHLVDAHQRVMSVAALQKQLAVSRLGSVELRPYFTALCQSIGASMIRDHDQLTLEAQTDDTITTADTSVSLGPIVTELVINALKHAFPGNRSGKILVDYHSRGPNWTLSVGDNGVGMPAEPTSAKAGLGTSIVQALAKQLGANVSIADVNPGTRVSVVHAHVPVLVGHVAAIADRPV